MLITVGIIVVLVTLVALHLTGFVSTVRHQPRKAALTTWWSENVRIFRSEVRGTN